MALKLTPRQQAVARRIEQVLQDPAYGSSVEMLAAMVVDAVDTYDKLHRPAS